MIADWFEKLAHKLDHCYDIWYSCCMLPKTHIVEQLFSSEGTLDNVTQHSMQIKSGFLNFCYTKIIPLMKYDVMYLFWI